MELTFSIIIPAYNRGYIIWETIQSIQNQSWPYWELIVVDDGSTDETVKVIREFQYDPRIHYYYKKNAGSSSARNFGLKKCTGEIVTYVDSDDKIFPNYLSLARQHFLEFPKKSFALANGNFKIEIYDNQGFIVSSEQIGLCYPKKPSIQNFYDWKMRILGGTGLFHKKDLVEKNHIEWQQVSPVEDLEFLMQLSSAAPKGFLYISQVCFEYKQRYGKDGIYANTASNHWDEAIQKIYEMHKNDLYMTHPTLYQKKFAQYQKKYNLSEIRHLSKPAAESKLQGGSERRTGVYTQVYEDSSTESTKQFASAVGFGKMSITKKLKPG